MADRTYHRDNTWISIDPAVWLRLEEKLAVQLEIFSAFDSC